MQIRLGLALSVFFFAGALPATAHDCPKQPAAAATPDLLALSAALAASPAAPTGTTPEVRRSTDAYRGQAGNPLFLLDLEQLLDVKVSLASKQEERGSGAAASISAYSKSFLDQFGVNSLANLAELTPGYSTYSIYGERVFETRGQKAASYNNNRHLMLIDGIPIQHGRNNKVFSEEDLPLQFADRVELLRGPASSLYGSGAVFGVVSITPRAASGGTQVDTRLGAGNEQARSFSTVASSSQGAADTLVSFSYYRKADSLAQVGRVPDPNNLYRDGRSALFGYVSHRLTAGPLEGLTIGAFYNEKSSGLGEHWYWGNYTNGLNQLTWTTLIPYLKLDRQIGPDLNFHGYLKMNESAEKGVTSTFDTSEHVDQFSGIGQVAGKFEVRTRNVEAQAELQWKAAPGTDVTAGLSLSADRQTGGDGVAVQAVAGAPYDQGPVAKTGLYRTASFYVQGRQQLDLLAGLSVLAGLRLDQGTAPGNGNRFTQLSPRLGLVQRLDERTALKLLYGTALSAPGLKEIEFNKQRARDAEGAGQTPPRLKAEQFKSLEAVLSYTGELLGGTLTVFTNRSNNLLDRPLNSAFYENIDGTTRSRGAEAELRFGMGRRWNGWLNASFARATDPVGKGVEDVPGSTASAGLTTAFDLGVPMQASLALRHVGRFRVSDPALPTPPGATLLDLRLAMMSVHGVGLSLDVKNLGDKVFRYPKAGRPDVPSPGRRFMFTLHASFD